MMDWEAFGRVMVMPVLFIVWLLPLLWWFKFTGFLDSWVEGSRLR